MDRGPIGGVSEDWVTNQVSREACVSIAVFRRVMAGAVAASFLGAASAFGAGDLQEELRHLLNARKLGAARVGVLLMDSSTNAVLAELNPDEPFVPASNMKLLTSGAAMFVLGPEFAFKTELLLVGDRLVVKGDADPGLADPALLATMEPKISADDVLRTLAIAAAKAAQQPPKELVIDGRVLDRELIHPQWNKDDLLRDYSAQVCGLNFHANVLSVYPRPNPSGGPPLYETQPRAEWLRIDTSRARTAPAGKGGVWVHRDTGANNFSMRGEVKVAAREPVNVTVHDPAEYFGRLFASALTEQGVGPLPVRFAEAHEQFEGRPIAVITTPIADVIRRCNTDSENLYAEALIKRIGHAVTGEPGSWSNGASVVRMMISQELGPQAAASTVISDGSGLSRANAVTPRTLARWLDRIADKPWGGEFIESLARPGVGTLEKRFQGTRLEHEVRAKSGYINGVRSLSGYVSDSASGRRLVFTILVNDLSLTTSEPHAEAKELMEDIVRLLDARLSARSETADAERGG